MILNYISVVFVISHCYNTPLHPSPKAVLLHLCLQMILIVFHFLNLLSSMFFIPSSYRDFCFLHSVRCFYKCREFSSCPWSDSLSFLSSVFVAMPDKLFIFPHSFPFFAWKTNINQKSPCFVKLLMSLRSLVLERPLLCNLELAGHIALGLAEGKRIRFGWPFSHPRYRVNILDIVSSLTILQKSLYIIPNSTIKLYFYEHLYGAF